MKDRYLNTEQSVIRLTEDFHLHGDLIIAFDFDNTVFDFHSTGDTFPELERMLKFLKFHGFTLILFTSRIGKELNYAIEYCEDNGYAPNFINESPVMKTKKPYYNILLDDRAGLNESYSILKQTLKNLNYEY